ncbi:hypothetical protein HOY80DRAFT_1070861 [Tuber brumale]|nr:hypothetical protein HOY80DRAFT_1070861 [Tuber brumale]
MLRNDKVVHLLSKQRAMYLLFITTIILTTTAGSASSIFPRIILIKSIRAFLGSMNNLNRQLLLLGINALAYACDGVPVILLAITFVVRATLFHFPRLLSLALFSPVFPLRHFIRYHASAEVRLHTRLGGLYTLDSVAQSGGRLVGS